MQRHVVSISFYGQKKNPLIRNHSQDITLSVQKSEPSKETATMSIEQQLPNLYCEKKYLLFFLLFFVTNVSKSRLKNRLKNRFLKRFFFKMREIYRERFTPR